MALRKTSHLHLYITKQTVVKTYYNGKKPMKNAEIKRLNKEQTKFYKSASRKEAAEALANSLNKAYNASQRNTAISLYWESKSGNFIDWYAQWLLNEKQNTVQTISLEQDAISAINGQYDLYNTYNIGTKLPYPFSDDPIPPIIKH